METEVKKLKAPDSKSVKYCIISAVLTVLCCVSFMKIFFDDYCLVEERRNNAGIKEIFVCTDYSEILRLGILFFVLHILLQTGFLFLFQKIAKHKVPKLKALKELAAFQIVCMVICLAIYFPIYAHNYIPDTSVWNEVVY